MNGKDVPSLGLESTNRKRLAELHRAFRGPFEVGEAASVLGVERKQASRFLAYLASRGWLSRVRRGLYTTVPLEASDPGAWLADPWAVAAHTFDPCYIGGWTALHHWELTEQLFRTVVVFTTQGVRRKERTVQGTVFRLREVSEERLFGTSTVWREKVPVKVSDVERTLIDVLDRPEVGGGVRHVADCLEEWAGQPKRNPKRLLEYALRLGNRTVFKRLGYVLEARDLGLSELQMACREEMSTGVSALEPTSSVKGRIVKRWRLRVNARI